ncbi:GroES-like protein [Cryphonectria parasitica EP155]|uniref:GroES-like protein n=1 Tax=Cryphonectria parasitica (strain ATCC 38755 / EP155) TaxID=660469 RepID=A0A9P5CLG4_CRYP1|nr:GroES-like protein [Cryphonectria parasitica EP155]KAF3763038.1 GroES-like protein [Cryphonectria parasitica EP155]
MLAAKLPISQTAILQNENGSPKLMEGVPLPSPKAGTVIVKTVAVALNPSDNKMGAAFPTPGSVVGMDFSGTVAFIPPGTTTDLRLGDRVCGMVHGSNPGDLTNGAFAEYVRARPEFLLPVPPTLSMEEAATLGVALMTNLLALWEPSALGLAATADPDKPAEKPFPVLVYGGSTATGTIALQLLRLSGLTPIAVCSPRNFDLARDRGAAAALDYMRPDLVAEIQRLTGGKLRYVYDCIADPETVAHCYAAIGRTGGRYASLELVPEALRTRRAVRLKLVLAYEASGEDVPLSNGYETLGDLEKRALAERYIGVFRGLLDKGLLKTHPIQNLGGGLQRVLEGLKMLRSGAVSGQKLVVTM